MAALSASHLAQRKRRPRFQRQDSNKDPRLAGVWRRPRGLHNKLRTHRKGHEVVPSIGFRSARVARGVHKSGLLIVHVANLAALRSLDAQQHCVVFSSSLGARKRLALYAAAQQAHLKVLGISDLGKAVSSLTKAKHSAPQKVEDKKKEEPTVTKTSPAEVKAAKPRAAKKPREVSS